MNSYEIIISKNLVSTLEHIYIYRLGKRPKREIVFGVFYSNAEVSSTHLPHMFTLISVYSNIYPAPLR